jgi:hypothetical protein
VPQRGEVSVALLYGYTEEIDLVGPQGQSGSNFYHPLAARRDRPGGTSG